MNMVLNEQAWDERTKLCLTVEIVIWLAPHACQGDSGNRPFRKVKRETESQANIT